MVRLVEDRRIRHADSNGIAIRARQIAFHIQGRIASEWSLQILPASPNMEPQVPPSFSRAWARLIPYFGAGIYEEAMVKADVIDMTLVPDKVDGNNCVYFPKIDETWKEGKINTLDNHPKLKHKKYTRRV